MLRVPMLGLVFLSLFCSEVSTAQDKAPSASFDIPATDDGLPGVGPCVDTIGSKVYGKIDEACGPSRSRKTKAR